MEKVHNLHACDFVLIERKVDRYRLRGRSFDPGSGVSEIMVHVASQPLVTTPASKAAVVSRDFISDTHRPAAGISPPHSAVWESRWRRPILLPPTS